MKNLRRVALTALVLLSAAVVVSSPAFATPVLTSSTGIIPDNGAVSPFFTPIGNTTTSFLRRTSPGFSVSYTDRNAVLQTVTCTSIGQSYIPATHTQVRVTRLDFTTCVTSVPMAIASPVVSNVSSTAHFLIHVTGGGAISWRTTFGIPPGGVINYVIRDARGMQLCQFEIVNQSIRSMYTNTGRTVEINDPGVRIRNVFVGSNVCPNDTRLAIVTGVYMVAPATPNDRVRITAAS